jgi:hypothetical protein
MNLEQLTELSSPASNAVSRRQFLVAASFATGSLLLHCPLSKMATADSVLGFTFLGAVPVYWPTAANLGAEGDC